MIRKNLINWLIIPLVILIILINQVINNAAYGSQKQTNLLQFSSLASLDNKVSIMIKSAKSRVYFTGLLNKQIENALIESKKNSNIVFVIIYRNSIYQNPNQVHTSFNRLKYAFIPSAIKNHGIDHNHSTNHHLLYSILIDNIIYRAFIDNPQYPSKFIITKALSSKSQNIFLSKFFHKVKFTVRSSDTQSHHASLTNQFTYNYSTYHQPKPNEISDKLPSQVKYKINQSKKNLRSSPKQNPWTSSSTSTSTDQQKTISLTKCINMKKLQSFNNLIAVNSKDFICQSPESGLTLHQRISYFNYHHINASLACKNYLD